MIGLSLLLVIITYIYFARLIIKKIDDKKIRYVVLAIYILVPTWDTIPGKITFRYLCYKEGGEKIFKTADGIPGFLRLFGGSGPASYTVQNYGYEYNEVKSRRNDYTYYSMSHDGIITASNFDEPISEYSFYEKKHEYSFPWTIIRYDQIIDHIDTKEIMAIRTRFNYSGGWVSRYLGHIGGGTSTCPRKPMSYKEFFNNTLKPVNK